MNTTHPRWQDLLTKLLHQEHVDEPVSEVEPYQAQPALGLDLGLAWPVGRTHSPAVDLLTQALRTHAAAATQAA